MRSDYKLPNAYDTRRARSEFIAGARMRSITNATGCHLMSASATFCLKALGVACPAFNTLIFEMRFDLGTISVDTVRNS
jgi:hypothetical protein